MNFLGGGKVEHTTMRKDGQFKMKVDTTSALFS